MNDFRRVVEDEGYNAVYGHYVDRVTRDGSLSSVAVRLRLETPLGMLLPFKATPSIFEQFPLACAVTKAVVGIDVTNTECITTLKAIPGSPESVGLSSISQIESRWR